MRPVDCMVFDSLIDCFLYAPSEYAVDICKNITDTYLKKSEIDDNASLRCLTSYSNLLLDSVKADKKISWDEFKKLCKSANTFLADTGDLSFKSLATLCNNLASYYDICFSHAEKTADDYMTKFKTFYKEHIEWLSANPKSAAGDMKYYVLAGEDSVDTLKTDPMKYSYYTRLASAIINLKFYLDHYDDIPGASVFSKSYLEDTINEFSSSLSISRYYAVSQVMSELDLNLVGEETRNLYSPTEKYLFIAGIEGAVYRDDTAYFAAMINQMNSPEFKDSVPADLLVYFTNFALTGYAFYDIELNCLAIERQAKSLFECFNNAKTKEDLGAVTDLSMVLVHQIAGISKTITNIDVADGFLPEEDKIINNICRVLDKYVDAANKLRQMALDRIEILKGPEGMDFVFDGEEL